MTNEQMCISTVTVCRASRAPGAACVAVAAIAAIAAQLPGVRGARHTIASCSDFEFTRYTSNPESTRAPKHTSDPKSPGLFYFGGDLDPKSAYPIVESARDPGCPRSSFVAFNPRATELAWLPVGRIGGVACL